MDYGKLENKIGYSFKAEKLLRTALTHSSYTNEQHGEFPSYERLEFLGDSILGFVTAEFLFDYEPPIPEGRMTQLRADLVCERNLSKVARELGLGKYLLLSHGEEKGGGREKSSVLGDIVESLIAAIYLDSDFEHAKKFIVDNILNAIDISRNHESYDYKSALQQIVQQEGEASIVYEEVSETGPDHDKVFTFKVVVNGIEGGTGCGKTKKAAEQEAARKTLEMINF